MAVACLAIGGGVDQLHKTARRANCAVSVEGLYRTRGDGVDGGILRGTPIYSQVKIIAIRYTGRQHPGAIRFADIQRRREGIRIDRWSPQIEPGSNRSRGCGRGRRHSSYVLPQPHQTDHNAEHCDTE